jgi:hypothetical protein
MEEAKTDQQRANNVQFQMEAADRQRLEGLPWQERLEEWPAQGVVPLMIRRGLSRHPVIFVEREGQRYAIKETAPFMAEREISNLREIERRGIASLGPVGSVTVTAPPILIEAAMLGGVPQYMSGDRGYTVTRLAARVIPQELLYRIPFTRKNKHHLLAAIAVLMIELHEHGVYWGDPSLANILIRIDGKQILAIMADAETVELFPGAVNDRLREQDLESFNESLLWEAEDIRHAHGIADDDEQQLIDDRDFRYFKRRYQALRREHAQITSPNGITTMLQVMDLLSSLNTWGYALLDMGGQAFQQITTVLPGWYQRHIYRLLGITIPRKYARRFYNMILGHQAIMRRQERRDVSLEEAAKDWYSRYHLPTILLLRQRLTSDQDPMQVYFAIMDLKWKMSIKAGYEVPIEEAALAWTMQQAETGKLGAVDPASIASWWHGRESVIKALEPPLIANETLEPLLSEQEQPLVRLPEPELEQKLEEILEQIRPDEERE